MLQIDSFGITHPGKVRTKNEDWLAITEPVAEDPGRENGFLYAVCDGIGGEKGGERASKLGIETLTQYFYSQPKKQDPATGFIKAIKAANKQVYLRARDDPSLLGMGATLTAVLLTKTEAFIGHVGDSRAYLLRADNFIQATSDHTNVQGALYRSLGNSESVKIEAKKFILRENDWIFICSDGLHEALSPDFESVIRKSVSPPHASAETVCETLIATALPASRDNLTIIAARVGTDQPVRHQVQETSITENYRLHGKVKEYYRASPSTNIDWQPLDIENKPAKQKKKKKSRVPVFMMAGCGFMSMAVISILSVGLFFLYRSDGSGQTNDPSEANGSISANNEAIADSETLAKNDTYASDTLITVEIIGEFGKYFDDFLNTNRSSIEDTVRSNYFYSDDDTPAFGWISHNERGKKIAKAHKTNLPNSKVYLFDMTLIVPESAFAESGGRKKLRNVFSFFARLFNEKHIYDWGGSQFIQRLVVELDANKSPGRLEVLTDFYPEGATDQYVFRKVESPLTDKIVLRSRTKSKMRSVLINYVKMTPNIGLIVKDIDISLISPGLRTQILFFKVTNDPKGEPLQNARMTLKGLWSGESYTYELPGNGELEQGIAFIAGEKIELEVLPENNYYKKLSCKKEFRFSPNQDRKPLLVDLERIRKKVLFRVIDEEGEPIRDAIVGFKQNKTDKNGSAILSLQVGIRNSILVRKDRYYLAKESFFVQRGESAERVVVLRELSSSKRLRETPSKLQVRTLKRTEVLLSDSLSKVQEIIDPRIKKGKHH